MFSPSSSGPRPLPSLNKKMHTVSMTQPNPLCFQARHGVSNCHGSLLKPITRSFQTQADRASASKFTRETVDDLVDLLYNRSPPPDIYVEPGYLKTPWMDLEPALEEMSPWLITLLKRLYYDASGKGYLPWDSLHKRWREIHGSNDWDGLLDPLDETLQDEIVVYGDLINSAYRYFCIDQGTAPSDSVPLWPYNRTKSLHVTSSVGLPKWMDDVAPNLSWLTQRTSPFGYVAVSSNRERGRMGRRDIIIVLRGTATHLEWFENMRINLVPLDPIPSENDWKDGQPKVARGFLSLYKTAGAHVPSLSKSVVTEVREQMKLYKGETFSITVIGHSLGAALALLVADELSTCSPDMPPIAVFSFAGPHVGNRGFWNRLTTNNVKVLRIVNSPDVVTKVPGIFLSKYAHGGTELKVDSKNSPYLKDLKNSPLLKSKADKMSSHGLEAYIHLVNGFLDSICPFGPNTKMLENLEYQLYTLNDSQFFNLRVKGSV